ncbi:MAG: hypothetical protein HW403_1530 [Dehalococcoidia bacterium]|nr:hypothetical protein [Dehalococcoidia bacterium]
MYSLLAALTLAAALSLVSVWQHRGRSWWWIYTLAASLSLYTHPLAGLTLGSLTLAVLIASGWDRRLLRGVALSSAAALLVFSPWAAILVNQASRVVGSFWVGSPSLLSPLASLYVFVFGFSLPPWLVPVGLFLTLTSTALAILLTIKHPHDEHSRDGAWLMVALWLAIPPLGLYTLSLIQPVYLERVIIGAAFPFYILMAWVAGRTRPRAVGLAGALGLAAFALRRPGVHQLDCPVSLHLRGLGDRPGESR